MSLIEDIKKLPKEIIIWIIGLAIHLPFWFLSLYVIGAEEVDPELNIAIPVIASFCITILWFPLFATIILAHISEADHDYMGFRFSIYLSVLLITIVTGVCKLVQVDIEIFVIIISAIVLAMIILLVIMINKENAKSSKR